MVLIAPRLARITPVGFPAMMSLSVPHRKPDEKFRFISQGSSRSAVAMPPGLQTPPVLMWKPFKLASFSTSLKLIHAPRLFLMLNATTGPLLPA